MYQSPITELLLYISRAGRSSLASASDLLLCVLKIEPRALFLVAECSTAGQTLLIILCDTNSVFWITWRMKTCYFKLSHTGVSTTFFKMLGFPSGNPSHQAYPAVSLQTSSAIILWTWCFHDFRKWKLYPALKKRQNFKTTFLHSILFPNFWSSHTISVLEKKKLC